MSQTPQEIDPLIALEQAIEATPPDIEKARKAIAEVGLRLHEAADKSERAAQVSRLSGALAIKITESQPPLDAGENLSAEFAAHEATYATISEALGTEHKPQKKPTQTSGKDQSGGKS